MALAHRYTTAEKAKTHYTEAEYFEFERTSVGRWEYVDGEIRAMSGGTLDHSAISMNIGRALGNVLVPRGCRIYGSDAKIHTGNGVNTFPDMFVICGQSQLYMGKTDVAINPLLIVEVLSPSTEGYDRGEKFEHYKTIASLQDYLLVNQNEARVELFFRRDGTWEKQSMTGLESRIYLPSVGVDLALSDVYATIEFQ